MTQSRRDFLRKTGCALSMAALATQVEHFGLMSALAQETGAGDGGDYKALVCIFMSGGNDGNNTVVPNHSDASLSNYATYSGVRTASGLAIPQASLLPITVPRMGGLTYGLHPNLVELQTLWNQQKLGIVTNVGTLVQPMTRTTYQNNSVPKPYQLFSHSDQVQQAQSANAATPTSSGWGGRTSDLLAGLNTGAQIPMITSVAGTQLFTAGQVTKPLAVNPAPTALNQLLTLTGYNTTAESLARRAAYDQLRTVDLSSNVVRAVHDITQEATIASTALNRPDPTLTTTFPNTSIGNQLRQVAKFLAIRNDITINRQIFFCSLGGFDTHTGEVAAHVTLLGQLSQAMKAFYDETVALSIADKVTTFTLSDFGRTLLPSGVGAATVGTDHAWANHMFVMGGSVLGGNFYGMNTSNGTPYPTLQLSGPDDADNRGRFIPTTAVEQYAATLATWYGLGAGSLSTVFPFLSNFGSNNLGFMT
ncbi:MAG: DUF1501 domain-containing protein [Pyrinomonadaceae bacterium]|nr:DUF1501 domain-containing protein [Pyrinomonadaceae bacterium]